MREARKVFMFGASGMGMAPLACYLAGSGTSVEAYDDNFKEPVYTLLQECGVTVLHEPNPLRKPDLIIRSSAVSEKDPRLIPFKKSLLPIYRRGSFISRFCKSKRVVVIAGSHGKTTTTGMLVWALREVGFSFSYMVGGRFVGDQLPMGSCDSGEKSPWLILELDESDGTMAEFAPEVTTVLNCDWDHVDQYSNPVSLEKAFTHLFEATKSAVVVPRESKLEKLSGNIGCELVRAFETAPKPAEFMASNRNAVITTAKAMGVDISGVDFTKFPGMERRQAVLFDSKDLLVVEDYAHHPAEIRSFLKNRRQDFPGHLMKVLFQPHRYSRTKAFASSFAEELSEADELQLMPTYGAFEKYDTEGTAESLVGYLPPRLRQNAEIHEDFLEFYNKSCAEDSISKPLQMLFVGAGNIDRWASATASMLKAEDDRFSAIEYYLRNRLSEACLLSAYESLGSKTTMGVGGAARWYAEPRSLVDLRALIEACELLSIPRVMLGRGSNLIVPDEGYSGLVIRMKGPSWSRISRRSDDSMIVGAGARLKEICLQACKAGLRGFEFLEGIPGTLGGALRMNAGAMGWEIFDLVDWVSFLLPDGTIREISGSDLNVGYRHCKEAENGIALHAKLRGEGRSDFRAIRKTMENMARKRRSTQPREASAGCVFRNPEEVSAGWLIEKSGLKGESVGAARISEVHGNFIVNEGGATAEDVISLMRKVKNKVKEEQGIDMQPEVGLLGKKWEKPLS